MMLFIVMFGLGLKVKFRARLRASLQGPLGP
jgi:hypothetical protein